MGKHTFLHFIVDNFSGSEDEPCTDFRASFQGLSKAKVVDAKGKSHDYHMKLLQTNVYDDEVQTLLIFSYCWWWRFLS